MQQIQTVIAHDGPNHLALLLMKILLDFVIHPHRKERLAWDIVILVLVFYASVHEPYKAAFLEQKMEVRPYLPDPHTHTHRPRPCPLGTVLWDFQFRVVVNMNGSA